MTADVSDSFKRAFQEIATERENLRNELDTKRLEDESTRGELSVGNLRKKKEFASWWM